MAYAHPHALILFLIDIAGFAEALVQSVHIYGVAVVDSGHIHHGLAAVGEIQARYFGDVPVLYVIGGITRISLSLQQHDRLRAGLTAAIQVKESFHVFVAGFIFVHTRAIVAFIFLCLGGVIGTVADFKSKIIQAGVLHGHTVEAGAALYGRKAKNIVFIDLFNAVDHGIQHHIIFTGAVFDI